MSTIESPFDFSGKRVNCKKHGNNSYSVEYIADEQVFIRVCFKCYAEKQTAGLINHAKNNYEQEKTQP